MSEATAEDFAVGSTARPDPNSLWDFFLGFSIFRQWMWTARGIESRKGEKKPGRQQKRMPGELLGVIALRINVVEWGYCSCCCRRRLYVKVLTDRPFGLYPYGGGLVQVFAVCLGWGEDLLPRRPLACRSSLRHSSQHLAGRRTVSISVPDLRC